MSKCAVGIHLLINDFFVVVLKEKKLESLAAMDTELQKIAAKLHDNGA